MCWNQLRLECSLTSHLQQQAQKMLSGWGAPTSPHTRRQQSQSKRSCGTLALCLKCHHSGSNEENINIHFGGQEQTGFEFCSAFTFFHETLCEAEELIWRVTSKASPVFMTILPEGLKLKSRSKKNVKRKKEKCWKMVHRFDKGCVVKHTIGSEPGRCSFCRGWHNSTNQPTDSLKKADIWTFYSPTNTYSSQHKRKMIQINNAEVRENGAKIYKRRGIFLQLTVMFLEASSARSSTREHLYSPDASRVTFGMVSVFLFSTFTVSP